LRWSLPALMSQMGSIDWTSMHPGHNFRRRERLVDCAARVPRIEARGDPRARQEKVAARSVPRATEAELTHGIPLFFDQLIDIMKRSKLPSAEMNASATKHGNEMLRMGFGVGQVVHDYGDVC